MKHKSLRGGIIGFGKMGLLHGAIINSLPNSTLVAVCDPELTVQKTLTELAPKLQVFRDYNSMLDETDLDFAIITTPTFLHVPAALACIRNGVHFLIEKPLAANETEARVLLSKLKRKPVITMIGYMMRYMETFSEAKKILDQKIIGRPLSVQATIYVSQLFSVGKGWRYVKEKSGGGSINTQATHALDLLCWYFGMPRAVNARTRSFYSNEVEDFGHVTFSWKHGLLGWLDSSWSMDNHRLLETSFTITGEYGTLSVDDDYIRIYLRKSNKKFSQGWTTLSKPDLFTGVSLDIGAPHFSRQDQDFVNHLIVGKHPLNDAFNGYLIQQLTDCIYASARADGKTVILPETYDK